MAARPPSRLLHTMGATRTVGAGFEHGTLAAGPCACLPSWRHHAASEHARSDAGSWWCRGGGLRSRRARLRLAVAAIQRMGRGTQREGAAGARARPGRAPRSCTRSRSASPAHGKASTARGRGRRAARAPGAHRDHAREADLPARRMARQAQRGGAAVARRAPRARTAIMHAKKICQPSAWLNELASSSNANSRPPMGALNATAMPTAVPAWRTPWRVRACVCVSIAWLAAHIRVHPTPCMNVPASWSCAPVRATTHTRPQALQRLCSVARALDCNPRPCQSPAHPGPYSHPLHWSPWVAPIISSRAS
jgi:hypothetical protein